MASKKEPTAFDILEGDGEKAIIFYCPKQEAMKLKTKYERMGLPVIEDKSLVTGPTSPYDLSKISKKELSQRTAIIVYTGSRVDPYLLVLST